MPSGPLPVPPLSAGRYPPPPGFKSLPIYMFIVWSVTGGVRSFKWTLVGLARGTRFLVVTARVVFCAWCRVHVVTGV